MTSEPKADGFDQARALLNAPEWIDAIEGEEGLTLEDVQNAAPPHPPSPEAELSPLERAAREPLNDVGNGRRFVIYHGEDALRVYSVMWHKWAGTHWAADAPDTRLSPSGRLVRELAQDVTARMYPECLTIRLPEAKMAQLRRAEEVDAQVRALRQKADRTPSEVATLAALEREASEIDRVRKQLQDARKKHWNAALQAGNSGKINAMLNEAAVSLSVPVEAMDADPLVVNCQNATLRFSVDPGGDGLSRTASLNPGPHSRADQITKLVPVDYDPKATCPQFETFLETVQPAPEMRAFLQRWMGYSMLGLTVEQVLAIFYGSGRNGKSVLVDLMAKILGNYSATAQIETLTGQSKRSGSDATPDLIPLIGARMVRASEPEQGERFKEGFIKAITGGEPILVRANYGEFVEVTPKFKLTISGNHKPEIHGGDEGIWRRMLLVPWDVQIDPEKVDPKLPEKLWAEASGIFNWMVDGAVAYLEDGLNPPEVVRAATKDYRDDSDPMGAFLTQCCVITGDSEDITTAKDLVEAFNEWRVANGAGTWFPNTVGRKLKEKEGQPDPTTGRRFERRKRGTYVYAGIKFTELFERQRREWATSGASAAEADDVEF